MTMKVPMNNANQQSISQLIWPQHFVSDQGKKSALNSPYVKSTLNGYHIFLYMHASHIALNKSKFRLAFVIYDDPFI